MRLRVIAICAALAATPLAAQDQDEGLSLMEEGARLFLRGLQQEMEPAMEGLRDFAEELGPEMGEFFSQLGPAMREMMDEVEDWSAYHAPEMLPNGDIILRRKEPKTPVEPEPEVDETDI